MTILSDETLIELIEVVIEYEKTSDWQYLMEHLDSKDIETYDILRDLLEARGLMK